MTTDLPAPNPMREHFLLRPDVVFLNHGSFGACPEPVMAEYHRLQEQLEGEPVDFFQRRAEPLLRAAREQLGAFVGASGDDLIYVTNVTNGLHILLRWLTLRPGDEVLTTDHEYGSMEAAWRRFCEQSGARLVRMPVPLPLGSVAQVVEAIWSGVTAHTRVLYLSHITSPTALIFPVQELVRRAREAGLITIIDGAHAPGQIPLDLERLGADVYLGNCHKWLLSPKGTGFFYMRREMQERLWGERSTTDDERPGWPHDLQALQWQGTRDLPAYLTVPAALRFVEEHNWPALQAACHELVRYARRQIAQLTGLPPVIPDSPEWFGQMAICAIPPCDRAALHRRLFEEYRVEIPVTGHDEQLYVRVSAQAYNTQADVDALVEALRALLPQVTN